MPSRDDTRTLRYHDKKTLGQSRRARDGGSAVQTEQGQMAECSYMREITGCRFCHSGVQTFCYRDIVKFDILLHPANQSTTVRVKRHQQHIRYPTLLQVTLVSFRRPLVSVRSLSGWRWVMTMTGSLSGWFTCSTSAPLRETSVSLTAGCSLWNTARLLISSCNRNQK